MTGWSHGYNVSTGYTFGFYRETAPDWIDFALLSRGFLPPRCDSEQPFRYLELGCGQGFGLCLLAAANPRGDFLGVDFSPEHVAHAEALAEELGLNNVRFLERDFASLAREWTDGEARFDYVVLHGIYSWVPEKIRQAIVTLLAGVTRPGTAVYLSFNAMPGWVSTLPFQHMLRLLEKEGVAQGIAAVEAGRSLFEGMDSAGGGLGAALPGLKARIDATRTKPAPYLVQEYLHDSWNPLWCSAVMTELGQAKLSLAASATLAENLLPGILPKALQQVAESRSEPKLREDITDCLINQTFRRDLYVRGLRPRLPGDGKLLESFRFFAIKRSDPGEELNVTTSYGSIGLTAASVAPLFEALATGAKSLAELAAMPAAQADPLLLTKRLILLIHSGWIGCSRRPAGEQLVLAEPNAAIARRVAQGAAYRHVAAGSLGSGLAATETELLMLDAHLNDAAAFKQNGVALLEGRLASLGRTLAKDGQPLLGDAARSEMSRLVDLFQTRTLPAWQRLGVVD
nr:class I SAM-dependent methyltransferase [uncultured Sphingomonas sp.]